MKYVFLLYNIGREEHASPEAMAEWGAYEGYLAEDMCDPVGGFEKGTVPKSELAVREALDLVADEVAAWAEDATLVTATCLNFRSDGTCRGWVLGYESAALGEDAKVTVVYGLRVRLEPGASGV